MLKRIAIYLTCRKLIEQPENLIEKLALAEYGIANHCRKMAADLDPDLASSNPKRIYQSHNLLARFLFDQYVEERLHGQMLAALIGEPSYEKGGIGQIRHPGVISRQVEGLSQSGLFKWFYRGKKAADFSLADRLAMMCVLEEYSHVFYSTLFNLAPNSPLGRIAKKIAEDEKCHKDKLFSHSIELSGRHRAILLILKWKIRAAIAFPAAICFAWKSG